MHFRFGSTPEAEDDEIISADGEGQQDSADDNNDEVNSEESMEGSKIAKKPAAQKTMFLVGWDSEQCLAYRVDAADPAQKKQFTNNIVIPRGGGDLDPVVATWDDGWSHPITQMSIAQWRTKLECKKPEGVLWQGGGYVIRKKKDRTMLVYLSHDTNKKKQLCQVKVDDFKSIDDAVHLMSEASWMEEHFDVDVQAYML